MSEMTIYYVGIVVLAALIFLSAAKTLGEFAFLVSLALIGGGYAAVLAHAFFSVNALLWAAALTGLGIVVSRLSARRDIPTVAWRAAGLHATGMAATFTSLAFVTFVTSPLTPGGTYRLVPIAYSLLAAWNWMVALQMAWWVLTNHDGKSTWNYGDGYNPNDDYGQHD